MKFYNMTTEHVLQQLGSNKNGLSSAEVQELQQKYGHNELHEAKKKSVLMMFLEQFKDFIVIILLVSAGISLTFGEAKSAITIFVVLIINSILGVGQQLKAEKSLESLKKLSAPSAKVLRDGNKIVLPARELVPGDIVLLDAGDSIPADGRILESYSLQLVESALTGESTSINKTMNAIESEESIPIGDRTNMVFSGSLVTYGRGSFIVTETGMNTEIGRIATLLETAEKKETPLQKRLDEFGKKLSVAIIIICVIVFVLSIMRQQAMLDAFMFAVALAVAAVPEALASIVTIVLAVGTQRMAKKHAIIRKLPAVETLGAASVICSDKTGTLTQNKMTVMKIFVNGSVKEIGRAQKIEDETEKKLIEMSFLCNDAILDPEGKEIGDPTEVALVVLGEKYGYDISKTREGYERVQEIAFDSDRKLMSTVHQIGDKMLMITKGAPDVLFSRCIQKEESDNVSAFDEKAVASANEAFGRDALRVLAVAYKEISPKDEISVEDEKDLTFVGLVAMIDPPREEAKTAVEKCILAGIRPVMITGDHKITASAIAKQLGILQEGTLALEGSEIDSLSDEKLKQKVADVSVFARVSPEHKIRIVKAWQDRGMVVSMTGDGVNDAPALKQADIGVAMGITGTDVSKDASDMILTDDNFATIVEAVGEGRTIYNNIKKSIQFLLSGNTAGILSVFAAALVGSPNPFVPVHLLWINLVTDSLPALALGMEENEENVMDKKPRDVSESIFAGGLGLKIILEGIVIAIGTLTAFYIGLQHSEGTARTMAFSTLCLSRLVHGFNVRSDRSIFAIGWFTNPYIIGAFGLGVLLQVLVLTFPPLQSVFEVTSLTSNEVGIIAGLSILPLVVVEIGKLFVALVNKK